MFTHPSFLSWWSYGKIRFHVVAFARNSQADKVIIDGLAGSDHPRRLYPKSQKINFYSHRIYRADYFKERWGTQFKKIIDLCESVNAIPKVLLVLGAILLLIGLWYHLAPRAQYVDSSPKPGSELSDSPDNITVSFNRELRAESGMVVISTLLSESGDIYGARKTYTVTGPDPNDLNGLTLRVNIPQELPPGVYWVNWTAIPKHVGVRTRGSFYFAVDMAVPAHFTRDFPEVLYERDRPRQSQRAFLIAGVVLLAMGLFISSRLWRRSR